MGLLDRFKRKQDDAEPEQQPVPDSAEGTPHDSGPAAAEETAAQEEVSAETPVEPPAENEVSSPSSSGA